MSDRYVITKIQLNDGSWIDAVPLDISEESVYVKGVRGENPYIDINRPYEYLIQKEKDKMNKIGQNFFVQNNNKSKER